MTVTIEVPDEVWMENADIFGLFPDPDEANAFYVVLFGLGLAIARRSGSTQAMLDLFRSLSTEGQPVTLQPFHPPFTK